MMDIRQYARVFIVLCIMSFAGAEFASAQQTSKPAPPTSTKKTPKKKAKKSKEKNTLKASRASLVPTYTGNPGTVKHYFFPTVPGAKWTHRSITTLLDDSANVVYSDTSYNSHEVVSTDSVFSLERLPLVVYRTEGYKSKGDTNRGAGMYYVDDSLAMTVTNNSIRTSQNRVFLVSPLVEGNAWHEKQSDSVYCTIVSMSDSCDTPLGKYDSALVAITRRGYTQLTKFFVPGCGLVRSVFRAPGPRGRGLQILTTEMVQLFVPETKGKSLNSKSK